MITSCCSRLLCFLGFYLPLTCLVHAGTSSHEPGCWIHSDKARCWLSLGDDPAVVVVNINRCSSPLDVTFRVALSNTSEWSHTFVNLDETRPVKVTDHFVTLRVQIKQIEQQSNYHLQAGFSVDGNPENTFIDDRVSIERSTCAGQLDRLMLIIAVVVLSVIILASLLLLAICCRKRSRPPVKAENTLLSDVDGPPVAESSESSTSTTVIQNTVYRDSVLVDELVLPTIPEEGADHGPIKFGFPGPWSRPWGRKPKQAKSRGKNKKKGKNKEAKSGEKPRVQVREYLDDTVDEAGRPFVV